jgi:hypothetical protein
MKKSISLTLILFSTLFIFSQSPNYGVAVKPVEFENMPGLQSYAFGQYDGNWVLVGGRLDGLHRRQPWASFDAGNNNAFIYVVDPATEEVFQKSLTGLPTAIQEQFQTTNPNFHQDGKYLYYVGGYGYSNTAGDHITHDRLTRIDMSTLIPAVKNNTSISASFKSVQHADMANTGGQLEMIGDTFYLAGGQKFTGRYNPMGNATFTQQYHEKVMRFTVNENSSGNLVISRLPDFIDPVNLHRRDYNMIPQIFPDDSYGFTMFSGVFQPTQDLPFLNSVDVKQSGHQVNNNFTQYLNHYHCATAALYDPDSKVMDNLFFGGISQFYLDENDSLIEDTDVPFVNTIARVRRLDDGSMNEEKVAEMPGLLGSGSEFILANDIAFYEHGIIDVSELDLSLDSVLIGYVVGGIESSAKNIFFINTGSESWATQVVYEVYLVDKLSTGSLINKKQLFDRGNIYPNPVSGDYVTLSFKSQVRGESADVMIYDQSGRVIDQLKREIKPGQNSIELKAPDKSGIYYITVVVGQHLKTFTLTKK